MGRLAIYLISFHNVIVPKIYRQQFSVFTPRSDLPLELFVIVISSTSWMDGWMDHPFYNHYNHQIHFSNWKK